MEKQILPKWNDSRRVNFSKEFKRFKAYAHTTWCSDSEDSQSEKGLSSSPKEQGFPGDFYGGSNTREIRLVAANVVAICASGGYSIPQAHNAFLSLLHYAKILDNEEKVLYVELNSEAPYSEDEVEVCVKPKKGLLPKPSSKGLHSVEKLQVFIFHDGPVVIWGGRVSSDSAASMNVKAMGAKLLKVLSSFSVKKLPADICQEESMLYCHIPDVPSLEIPPGRIGNNCIFLMTHFIDEKLAASFALAQSVLLDTYELAISQSSERISSYPQIISKSGYKASSKSSNLLSKCTRETAELLSQIINVNIVEDFLDIPEYFWSEDKWQFFWKRMHNYLELEERINLLNRRFLCMQDFWAIVQDERSRTQEFRLLWIIIVLIGLQVVILIIKNFSFDD